MIISNGINDFENNTFEQYKWSANTYETAEEIVTFINDNGICEKRIKGVFAIGALMNFGVGNWVTKACNTLIEVGMIEEYDSWRDEIEFTDGTIKSVYDCQGVLENIVVDRVVTLNEPLIIEFEDGDTLELLPCGSKGLKMSINAIPNGMRNGINHCEIDIGSLFNEILLNNRIVGVDVVTKQHTVMDSAILDERLFSTRHEYHLDLYNDTLVIKELGNHSFEVFFYRNDKIRVKDLPKASLFDEQQGIILETYHGGGAINVYPVKGLGENQFIADFPSEEMFAVCYFFPKPVEILLERYFDEDLEPNRLHHVDRYDLYRWCFYSKESIIQLSNEAIELVDKARNWPIEKQWEIFSYLTHSRQNDTEEYKIAEINKKLDFTIRICKRLRDMAENSPDYDYISIIGP